MMNADTMIRAFALMTEAATAILANAPGAAELAEHALAQLRRAQVSRNDDAAHSEQPKA